MISYLGQEHMEPQEVRYKRKFLRSLREVLELQNHNGRFSNAKKSKIQLLINSMRINHLKNVFYQKLSLNNMFEEAVDFELLSEDQRENRRWIKLRGIQIHPRLFSLVFVFEMIFLLITLLISSWMAFIPEFISTQTYNSSAIGILNLIQFIISCVKFIIVAFSQKVQNGILIEYMTDIIVEYVKSLMMIADLIFIVVLGVILIDRQDGIDPIELYSVALFVCSIVRIIFSNQNLTLFRTTFMTSSKMDHYYKLIHLIIFNFIFAHFIASMLLAMAKINENDNWMIQHNLQYKPWYVQYFWSYYWATTTMITIGFGDFTPVTDLQALIMAFLQSFSCIILSYNISVIGAIISTIVSSQNQFITKIALFKRIAYKSNIDKQLSNKIESYLKEQKTIREKFQLNQINQFIKNLPETLREQFIISSNSKFFRSLPFFKNLQKSTLLKFADNFTSKIYYPKELLSKANQYNEQIMILKDGKIGLGFRKIDCKLNGVIVQEIQIVERPSFMNGDEDTDASLPILLTNQFLTPGKTVNYDIIALNYSNVSLLSHESFLAIIKENSIDSQYYFSIAHQHLSNGNQWKQFSCEICMSKSRKKYPKSEKIQDGEGENDNLQRRYFHTKFDCPRLHYFPPNGVIIYKHLAIIDQPQERQETYRRKQLNTNESCLPLRKTTFKPLQDLMISQKNKAKSFKRQTILQLVYLLKMIIDKDTPSTQSQKSLISPKTLRNDQIVQIKTEDNHFQNRDQSLWNLEIDLMANYLYYFSHQNSSKLDSIELDKKVVSKSRKLCINEGIKFPSSIVTAKNRNVVQVQDELGSTKNLFLNNKQGETKTQQYWKQSLNKKKTIRK